MKIVVRFFARTRDLAGTSSVSLELPEGARVKDLRARLSEAYPGLSGLLERSAIGIGNEFAANDSILTPGAEVALLPPVSGG